MDKEQLQAIGSGLAAVGIILTALWQAMRAAARPAAPPPERAPSQNETKAALDEMRASLTRLREEANDDMRDIERQLDRMERCLERLESQFRTDLWRQPRPCTPDHPDEKDNPR